MTYLIQPIRAQIVLQSTNHRCLLFTFLVGPGSTGWLVGVDTDPAQFDKLVIINVYCMVGPDTFFYWIPDIWHIAYA